MVELKKTGAAFLAFTLCVGGVQAAEGNYILKNGQLFRTDGGKERPIQDVEVRSVDTDAGRWAWILVDPGESAGMEASETGIHFFRGEEGRPAGFLPVEEEAGSCKLTFSPSGEKLLTSCGTNPIRHLDLYHIDKDRGFVKKASFNTLEPPHWIDRHRFVLTTVDMDKGLRTEGRFDLWWSSLALYDTGKEELTVLREASATRDYAIADYDGKSGALEIMESSVQDAKDWADEDKIEDKRFTLPLPGAVK